MGYGEWDVVPGKEVGRAIVVMEAPADCWVLPGSGEVSASSPSRDPLAWSYCWAIPVAVPPIGIA